MERSRRVQKRKSLADYKGPISDAFQSTFTIINPYVLCNLITWDEFSSVTNICKQYVKDVYILPIEKIGPKIQVFVIQKGN